MSFILTDYVYAGPRSNIREDMCDCLYHPETYLDDLNKQLERALLPVTDYTNASNKEYLEEQKSCAAYCLKQEIQNYTCKGIDSDLEPELRNNLMKFINQTTSQWSLNKGEIYGA